MQTNPSAQDKLPAFPQLDFQYAVILSRIPFCACQALRRRAFLSLRRPGSILRLIMHVAAAKILSGWQPRADFRAMADAIVRACWWLEDMCKQDFQDYLVLVRREETKGCVAPFISSHEHDSKAPSTLKSTNALSAYHPMPCQRAC